MGLYDKKKLCAVCERDNENKVTKYAYIYDENVISNDSGVAAMLGEEYDFTRKKTMKRLESFFVDHTGSEMPKVSEVGIKNAFLSWRMCTHYSVSDYELMFTLNTERTAYVFHVQVMNTNVYCGASNDTVFEMGLMSWGQYFRIRNYKDNSEPFCRFYGDFSFVPRLCPDNFNVGNKSPQGYADEGRIFMVKRYSDDEIVLTGCGDDEYFYHRKDDGASEVLCTE